MIRGTPSATITLALAVWALVVQVQAQQAGDDYYPPPGVSVGAICRARGYLAEEYFFTTQDGYIIKMTRCANPLINGGRAGLPNRQPILFIHGLMGDPSAFMVNSFNVQPKVLSCANLAANASAFSSEPSARVMPPFAMNCGHEVWFIHRRGTFGSQQKVGNPNSVTPNGANSSTGAPVALDTNAALLRLTSDPTFWLYSYDEQAKFDIPQAIRFVLKKSGRAKLSIVGHSAGGALTLMSLIVYPELADLIVSCVLWAPAFGLGDTQQVKQLENLESFFYTYSGSLPPASSVTQIQTAQALECSTDPTGRTTCEQSSDQLNGDSGGLQPIYPAYFSATLGAAAPHEFAQLVQIGRLGGLMHKLDNGPVGNLVAYGQSDPPAYVVARIRLPNISFFAGSTDGLVAAVGVERVLKQLTVPYKYTNITVNFNHLGYFFRDENADLVVIPTMVDLQTLNQ